MSSQQRPDPPGILKTIVAHKRTEIAAREAARPLPELRAALADASPVRGFAAAMSRQAAEAPAIIAEIKRGSPSLGCIRADLVASEQARAYAAGGAAALSVLTDEQFFFGSDADFRAARDAVTLPMLRKEFIIDAYQVYESRALGADCILLILSILSDDEAASLSQLAKELGMDVLAETHNREEIDRAQAHVPFDLLGVNNRNLANFHTDTNTTLGLFAAVANPDCLVAESGLKSPEVIAACWDQGIRRFLIGEAFVRSADPSDAVRRFIARETEARS